MLKCGDTGEGRTSILSSLKRLDRFDGIQSSLSRALSLRGNVRMLGRRLNRTTIKLDMGNFTNLSAVPSENLSQITLEC